MIIMIFYSVLSWGLLSKQMNDAEKSMLESTPGVEKPLM